MAEKRIDRAEVREALELLAGDGGYFEIRCIGMSSLDSRAWGTFSAFFDGSDPSALDKAAYMVSRLRLKESAKVRGVYVTLNPVVEGLKYKANAEWQNCGASGDEHVTRRRWFVVDLDSARIVDGIEIKGIPATDAEVAETVSTGALIREHLAEAGWPAPIEALSGNGSHLLWRIEEPNDVETRDLLKACLERLAEGFTTKLVDVDIKVNTAARIWKLYGTTGGKGSETEERPWRRAKLLTPEKWSKCSESIWRVSTTVSREQLEQLADVPEAPAEAPTSPRPSTTSRPRAVKGDGLDVGAWLLEHGLDVSKVESKGGGMLYELAVCPWFGEEHARKAWVHQKVGGSISHDCMGGRCNGRRSWHELRARYDAEYVEAKAAWESNQRNLTAVSGGRSCSGPVEVIDMGTESSTEVLEEQAELRRDASAIKANLFRAKPADIHPDDSMANLLRILSADARWSGVLAFDLLEVDIVTIKAPPWSALERDGDGWYEGQQWTDNDDTSMMSWLRREYDIRAGASGVKRAVNKAAAHNPIHRFREYLESLTWDGTARLAHWLERGCGVEDSEYARIVGARWLIAITARAHPPTNKRLGVKVDNVLVIEGPQGLGKSQALAALMPRPEWVSDSHLPIGHKDAFQSLAGHVIYELAEIDGYTSKREASIMKAFLTSAIDNYRPPYNSRNIHARRPCVFCGTANKAEYLIDETGNRRFWPVTATRIDLEWIKNERDQIWAEANQRRINGEIWWIDNDHERRLAQDEQRKRVIGDAWSEVIADRLSVWLKDWRKASKLQTYLRERVPTYRDVYGIFLGMPPERFKRTDNERVRLAMASLGFRLSNFRRPAGSVERDQHGKIICRDGVEIRRGDAGKSTRAFFPDGGPNDWTRTLERLIPIEAQEPVDDSPF